MDMHFVRFRFQQSESINLNKLIHIYTKLNIDDVKPRLFRNQNWWRLILERNFSFRPKISLGKLETNRLVPQMQTTSKSIDILNSRLESGDCGGINSNVRAATDECEKNFIDDELINLQIRFSLVIENPAAAATATLNTFSSTTPPSSHFARTCRGLFTASIGCVGNRHLRCRRRLLNINREFPILTKYFLPNKSHRTLFLYICEWKADSGNKSGAAQQPTTTTDAEYNTKYWIRKYAVGSVRVYCGMCIQWCNVHMHILPSYEMDRECLIVDLRGSNVCRSRCATATTPNKFCRKLKQTGDESVQWKGKGVFTNYKFIDFHTYFLFGVSSCTCFVVTYLVWRRVCSATKDEHRNQYLCSFFFNLFFVVVDRLRGYGSSNLLYSFERVNRFTSLSVWRWHPVLIS